MSPQGLRAVPPRREPTVLTVDTGSTGALTPRFLTLVVRGHGGQEQRTEEPAGDEVGDLPAAS